MSFQNHEVFKEEGVTEKSFQEPVLDSREELHLTPCGPRTDPGLPKWPDFHPSMGGALNPNIPLPPRLLLWLVTTLRHNERCTTVVTDVAEKCFSMTSLLTQLSELPKSRQ